MMAEKTFALVFHGYCRDVNKGDLPPESAVYCVYTCRQNEGPRKISVLSLLYIGEADDIRDRIASHEKRAEWQARLGPGQQLCYSFAPVEAADRGRCLAALVAAHTPPGNDPSTGPFPFETTNVSLEGKIRLLNPAFTVPTT